MKQWKKMISVVLICTMMVSLATLSSEVSHAAIPIVEKVYFEETFDEDGMLSGWASTNNSSLAACKALVSNGVYCIPFDSSQQYFMYAKAVEVSDYTVSCDVTLGKGERADNLFTTGIAARVTEAHKGGYEFQLCIEGDGSSYVRLRDRTGGSNFVNPVNVSISEGNTYTIKMEVYANVIKCYINNEVVIDYTDDASTYPEGSAAIRAAAMGSGIDVMYDNFKIYDVTVNAHKFWDDFNGYDGEATNAEKRIALEANGWYVSNNTNAGLLNGSAYVIPADNTVSTIVLQTQGSRGALGWNDYSVEADVTIGAGDLTKDILVSVTGRHIVAGGNDGYEIQFYETVDGTRQLRIYERNGGSVLANCDFPFEREKTYNLKAVFQGDKIYAYVDNKLYLTATGSAYPIGYAGIRKSGAACGAEVIFDNFVVYDYDIVPAAFREDFDSYIPTQVDARWDISKLNAKGWHSNSNAIMRTYVPYASNGVFKVPTKTTTATNLVLNNHATAADWKNYEIECDVTFNSDKVDAESGKYTYAIVSGRETESQGTGFGIALGATYEGKLRYIRLYENGKGATASAGDVVSVDLASADRIKEGTAVKVKLKFDGTKIIGYVNGEKKVWLTLDSESAVLPGYAGIHTTCDDKTGGGVDVTFDNFVVYDNDKPYVKEIVGDLNADAVVNAEDTTSLKTSLLSETYNNMACDVDKSSVIDVYDYVRIKRLVYSLEK